jgi:hypothetical protein
VTHLQEPNVSRTVSRLPAEGGSMSSHGNATPDYRIDPETGCWVWLKRLDHKGYGKINLPYVGTRYAHRAYWIAANGPVPEGRHVVIDHLCRNPACVNPKHLEAVEQATNVHRGRQAKLTMEIAREVRRLVREGVSAGEIEARLGVTVQNVWWIAEDKAWREDPAAPRQPVWPQRDCVKCGKPVVGRMRTAVHCSDECRKGRQA